MLAKMHVLHEDRISLCLFIISIPVNKDILILILHHFPYVYR